MATVEGQIGNLPGPNTLFDPTTVRSTTTIIRIHIHPPTPSVSLHLTMLIPLPTSIHYIRYWYRFQFSIVGCMRYQGNDNLCEFRFRLSLYPNRRHGQTLTEFGLTELYVCYVWVCVCVRVCVRERDTEIRIEKLGSSWEFSLYALQPLKPEPQMSNWIPVLFNWFREHNEPGHRRRRIQKTSAFAKRRW